MDFEQAVDAVYTRLVASGECSVTAVEVALRQALMLRKRQVPYTCALIPPDVIEAVFAAKIADTGMTPSSASRAFALALKERKRQHSPHDKQYFTTYYVRGLYVRDSVASNLPVAQINGLAGAVQCLEYLAAQVGGGVHCGLSPDDYNKIRVALSRKGVARITRAQELSAAVAPSYVCVYVFVDPEAAAALELPSGLV